MRDDIATVRQKQTHSSCECCHRRKVRCDVNTRGQPCTNCRLDEQRCIPRPPLKRGRKSRLERLVGQTTAASGPNSRHGYWQQNPAPESSASDGTSSTLEIPRMVPIAEASEQGDAYPSQVYVPFYYHKYLEVADMQHLSPTQVQSLEEQFCLRVPSGAVLDEFMCQYFLYIQPHLPLLEEGHVWSIYSNRVTTGPRSSGLSLALFQAMLFVASRFVTATAITACGFGSFEDARNAFRHRAELLLMHNLERDDVTLAQTSLLLSLQSTMTDQRLNSAWLAKAISHAEAAGASSYYRIPSSSAKSKLELKRLWWCCIVRDRMIALGVRRNVQITPDKFDFDQACLGEDDLMAECDRSKVYDSDSKRLLVKIFAAQCELAVAMTPTMMMTAYRTEHDPYEDRPTVSMVISAMAEIEQASTELSIWARRYKSRLTEYASEGECQQPPNASVVLFVDTALIHYYSTWIALCNYQVSTLKRHEAHLGDYEARMIRLSKDLRSNIAHMTEKMKQVSDRGLAHHLPVSAPSCSALPFILEILNLRLSSSTQKHAHQSQIDEYNRILRILRTQHDHTECVTTAIDTVLQVAEPEIFTLTTSRQSFRPGSRSRRSSHVFLPSNWTDVLARDPTFYLRLTLSLDLTLSCGRAPHIADLPVWAMGPGYVPSIPMFWNFPPLAETAETAESRFVELGDDEVTAAAQEEDLSSCTGRDPDGAVRDVVPAIGDEVVSLDSAALWSFADMPMGSIEQWFESI